MSKGKFHDMVSLGSISIGRVEGTRGEFVDVTINTKQFDPVVRVRLSLLQFAKTITGLVVDDCELHTYREDGKQ